MNIKPQRDKFRDEWRQPRHDFIVYVEKDVERYIDITCIVKQEGYLRWAGNRKELLS